jgi:hypothetical protein
MMECNEKPSYILVEELKFVKEAYSRVAVIEIDIRAGSANIYVGGGRGRGMKLVIFGARGKEGHTLSRIADIRTRSTPLKVDLK